MNPRSLPRVAITTVICCFIATTIGGCATSFDLQGHRGARGLLPENTLPAFTRAIALGVTTLELDVGLTADGVLVVAHDPKLNPDFTRDASGNWLAPPTPALRSLTYAEVSRYDVGRINPASAYAKRFPNQQARDGSRMPRLAEVLALGNDPRNPHLRFNIETKIDPREPDATANPETFVRAVITAIRDAGMSHRVTLQSFDWRTLRLAQALAPDIRTAYLTAEQTWLNNIADREGRPSLWTAGFQASRYANVPAMVKAAGASVWSPYHGDITEELVWKAKQLDLKVVPWTVNDPKDMQRLIGYKVDGLITDYPDRALPLLRAAGLKP